MQQENAIEVKNITKKFKVYYDKGSQLKERLLFRSRNRYEERKVLNDISFAVKKGEAVGLIGQNGCGKSTTLKLLTRIMYPDSGSIEMAGRVSSLIELGAGFHPDMSGRENIYTNAAIFGLTKKEINARVEDIIAFSELEEYIDNPVRTYSSGMYMRLAFSVAINVDADILMIDEILAVGDAAFQAKCFNRLREIKAEGTTIVIVSHSTGQIEQICDRAIWIRDGKIETEGTPRNVIQEYMSWIMGDDKAKLCNDIRKEDQNKAVRQSDIEKTVEEETEKSYEYTLEDILSIKQSGGYAEIGNHAIKITDYDILDAKTKKHKVRFSIGEAILGRVFYKRKDITLSESMFSLAIYRSDGLNCYSTNCFINTGRNVILQDEGVIEFLIMENPFMQGEYRLDISLNKDYGPTYHGIINACSFEVYNTTTDYGVCRPKIEWNLGEDGMGRRKDGL
jgi:ABC-2 type transport system ATP-binding protein